MTEWLRDDEQAAWRGLVQMTSRLNAALNRQLQGTSGLSLSDYDVLVPLSEAPNGQLRVYEIAGLLAWEQSRLSHHLTRMQHRGLITRQDCPTDRRGAFITLTDAGRAAITTAAPGHVAAVRRLVFDGLPPEDVAALHRISQHVLGRLSPVNGDAAGDAPRPHVDATAIS